MNKIKLKITSTDIGKFLEIENDNGDKFNFYGKSVFYIDCHDGLLWDERHVEEFLKFLGFGFEVFKVIEE